MRSIQETLSVFLASLPSNTKITIAYSGGVDSTVLLHALAQIRDNLSAIHINHNLYPDAEQWQNIAAENCEALGIDLHTVKLNSKPESRESIEAWARKQRLCEFEKALPKNGILLTAQHADDQTETVLLQLFRGSGAKGLMGMPAQKPLGQGVLARPFLTVEKSEILKYATENKLTWAEDHSNQDTRFDRNFLRSEIIPKLKERWPALNKTCARSISHLSELHENPAVGAALHAARAAGGRGTISIKKLKEHTSTEQKHLIRTWLEQKQFPMPPTTKLNEIITSVLNAKPDANPEVTWADVHIRRYRDELYALHTEETISLEGMEFEWDGKTPLELPHGAGVVTWGNFNVGDALYASRSGEARRFIIKFRTGGEKITLPGRSSKTLKNYFQENGIPPWQRTRTPLFYDKSGAFIAIVSGLTISSQS